MGEGGDWRPVRINPKLEKMLMALGLMPSADVPQMQKPVMPRKLLKWLTLPFFSMFLFVFSPCALQGDMVSLLRFRDGMASAGWSVRKFRLGGVVGASACMTPTQLGKL